MTTKHKPNRLAKEKSPYLLQHQYNPVDWFPWGEEAFDKAKQENKPIFLSIGYSTCHWCHVMERESFENEEVAAILNKDYISIKVDREERPDVDHLYMAVCQAMSGQGGWPLTIIMTPDKKPFFAGTYFPKSRKYGRYGMMDILPQIIEKWQEDRAKVEQIGEQITEEVQKRTLNNLQGEVTDQTMDQAYDQYAQMFDPSFGGFGSAPKFPTSHNLSFLLRYYQRTANEQALAIVEKTLESMYRGGLYDHIGFGFTRYSTDEKWLVPHFEKMLYDNALLAYTYLEAYQVTGKALYANVAENIFTYVLRDMTDKEGGFYSAEDADSEGHEGKFYVWEPDEIIEVLGVEDGELFCELFDITEEGNFEGHNIPNLIAHNLEKFATLKGIPLHVLTEKVEASRQTLFTYREQRIHPYKDDKILTSWNGLMIAALAKGYKVLNKPIYAEAARKAADFINDQLRREDGRLLARYREGEAAYPGYIDDYAFFTWGLIELYEATFDIRYLQQANEFTQQMIALFWDETDGGFFFYGKDSEQLLIRMKESYDGAMPSGNSVAALNLLKLSRYTYNSEMSQLADRQMQTFAGALSRYPTGHSMFMMALDFAFGPSGEIVIAGERTDETAQQMVEAVRDGFRPNTLTIFVPTGEEGEAVRKFIPLVLDKKPLGGKTTAYVCENFSCQSPTAELEELRELLL